MMLSLLALTLVSTSVLAAIQTVTPSPNQPLLSCTIQTLAWKDDGSSPRLDQIGMMDIVLMQGDNALRTLATVDALDLSAAVLLPCELPAASDYRIEYIPRSSIAAASSTPGLYRRTTPLEVVTTTPLTLTHRPKHTHTSSSSTTMPTFGRAQPHALRGFDLMTPAAPIWQTTSSPAAPQQTLPSARSSVTSRAVGREIGVHPGLIVMWIGVMCSMLML